MPGNPILLVKNNGRGVTPVPADALLQPGDTLNVHDDNDGSQKEGQIIAVVPVGTPVEIAIADQTGCDRPFMITKAMHKETLYVLRINGHDITLPQKRIKRGLDAAEAAGLNAEAAK